MPSSSAGGRTLNGSAFQVTPLVGLSPMQPLLLTSGYRLLLQFLDRLNGNFPGPKAPICILINSFLQHYSPKQPVRIRGSCLTSRERFIINWSPAMHKHLSGYTTSSIQTLLMISLKHYSCTLPEPWSPHANRNPSCLE